MYYIYDKIQSFRMLEARKVKLEPLTNDYAKLKTIQGI